MASVLRTDPSDSTKIEEKAQGYRSSLFLSSPAPQLQSVGHTSSRYVREAVRRLESEAGQSMGETTVDSLVY